MKINISLTVSVWFYTVNNNYEELKKLKASYKTINYEQCNQCTKWNQIIPILTSRMPLWTMPVLREAMANRPSVAADTQCRWHIWCVIEHPQITCLTCVWGEDGASYICVIKPLSKFILTFWIDCTSYWLAIVPSVK